MKFKKLASAWNEIENTSSMLEMTEILARFLKEVPLKELKKTIYLNQAQLAPAYKGLDIGMGEKLVQASLSKATGYPRERIEKQFQDIGDLGSVASELTETRLQKALFNKELTVDNVYDSFHKIATLKGTGSQDSKINTLTELFNNATPVESKYLARIPLGELRLGIRDATIMNALSVKHAGDKSRKDDIEDAYNIRPDLGEIAVLLEEKGLNGLKEVKIEIGTPIKSALCERVPTSEEILEKMQGSAAVEGKYDGFRLQVHKSNEKVTLFSRQMEDLTHMFPDIVKGVRDQVNLKDCILDAEALSFDSNTQQFHPFQTTMQRRRKHGVDKMAEKFPLKLFLFDVLYLEGKNLLDTPYKERRSLLENSVKNGDTLLMAEQRIVTTPKELDDFFQDCIEQGLEGVIAKKLDAKYTPGQREYAWIKLKRDYQQQLGDTIDAVILGYYKGKGSRTKFGLGGLLVGVYNPERDVFQTVSKIGTGFTEQQMQELSDKLSKLRVDKKPASVEARVDADYWVEPVHVVTIKAAEITRSSQHTCKREFDNDAYALRFPRIIGGIREDKQAEDATTVKEIVRLFQNQRKQGVHFRTGETEEEN